MRLCVYSPVSKVTSGKVTSAKQRFTDETHFDIEQSDIRYNIMKKKTDETQSDIEQSDIRYMKKTDETQSDIEQSDIRETAVYRRDTK